MKDDDLCVGIREDVNGILIDLGWLTMIHDLIGGIEDYKKVVRKDIIYETYFPRVKNFFARFKVCALKYGLGISELFENKVFNNLSISNVELALKYIAFECCNVIGKQEKTLDIQGDQLFEKAEKNEATVSFIEKEIENSLVFKKVVTVYRTLGVAEEIDDRDMWLGGSLWESAFWAGDIGTQISYVELFLTMLEKDMLNEMLTEEKRIYKELDEFQRGL